MRRVELIGGPWDGERFPFVGPVPPGFEVPLPIDLPVDSGRVPPATPPLQRIGTYVRGSWGGKRVFFWEGEEIRPINDDGGRAG